ncbi:MAG: acyl-ACP--UDP-N-acetylglucosamine O-acyltransferase [Gammaproteobacteria bacterium]
MENTIHSTAIISNKAILGESNTIGAFVIIEDDVVLGSNNIIHARCSIKKGSRIGSNNVIHEGCIFSGDPQDTSFKDCATQTVLGNDNVLREYVIIHRGSSTQTSTQIGDKNYLMNGVHLGHDCILSNNIIMAPYAALAGHVAVENNAFISGGVMVHQFTTIGCFAMVGGNSKITRGVLPYMITDGVPGSVKGLNSVGLRRAGFSSNSVKSLKQAFQILFPKIINPELNSLDGILVALQKIKTPEVEHLINFIKSQKRGFHRVKR